MHLNRNCGAGPSQKEEVGCEVCGMWWSGKELMSELGKVGDAICFSKIDNLILFSRERERARLLRRTVVRLNLK